MDSTQHYPNGTIPNPAQPVDTQDHKKDGDGIWDWADWGSSDTNPLHWGFRETSPVNHWSTVKMFAGNYKMIITPLPGYNVSYHVQSDGIGAFNGTGNTVQYYCGDRAYIDWYYAPIGGTIQGYKVVMPGNLITTPTTTQTVTLDGTTTSSASPYYFNGVTPGTHTVSVSVPAGYSVGFTLCYDNINCHNNTPTPGNTVIINVTAGGYADLWWHYNNIGINGIVYNDPNNTCSQATPVANFQMCFHAANDFIPS
jgi:hypothetical protein